MSTDELYDALETAIQNLHAYDLVQLNNGWVEDNNYWEDWIYSWDELDEVFENYTPSQLFEIFRDCEEEGSYFQKGDYSIRFGDVGDLVYFEDLTNWVYHTMDGYGIEELEDIIAEYLEQEDEEDEDEE